MYIKFPYTILDEQGLVEMYHKNGYFLILCDRIVEGNLLYDIEENCARGTSPRLQVLAREREREREYHVIYLRPWRSLNPSERIRACLNSKWNVPEHSHRDSTGMDFEAFVTGFPKAFHFVLFEHFLPNSLQRLSKSIQDSSSLSYHVYNIHHAFQFLCHH